MVREFMVRLGHDHGVVTLTVTGSDARSAVASLLAVERAPARAVQWVKVRPTCDFCDQPASRYERGGEETPLCEKCARDHFGTVRNVQDATGRLGLTRMPEVASGEWK